MQKQKILNSTKHNTTQRNETKHKENTPKQIKQARRGYKSCCKVHCDTELVIHKLKDKNRYF